MLRLKIVTYTPEFINKVNIESLTLLTKDGKQVSVITAGEMRIAEALAPSDASRRTFLIDNPIIGCTDEYDEEAMLDMHEEASILYGDITYNGDDLFSDEAWIEEISLRNEDRYAKIDRPVKRNFWNSTFKWFKKEQNESEYRGKLMGAGAAKRDAKIWEEFLQDYGIPYEAHKPQARGTKWSAETFANVTGYKGRTNEHNRDAALLVYGIR